MSCNEMYKPARNKIINSVSVFTSICPVERKIIHSKAKPSL